MTNQSVQTTGFCHNCGEYMRPEDSLVTWLEKGKAVICCQQCRDQIYKKRVENEKNNF